MSFNRATVTRYGNFIYNRNDLYIGTSIELYGEFAEHEMELLKQCLRPGSFVFDVGAHLGTHTLMFAKEVGPQGYVYAFEPQRVVFQTLCANVTINDLFNVECVHAAAGDSPGTVLMPDIDYTVPGNFGQISATAFTAGHPVRQVALDDYLDVARLDLLKIDVEGNEVAALAGARALVAKFRPLIYIENDRPENSAALIRALQSLRYRLYWHLPLLYNKQNFAGNTVDITDGRFSVNMLCVPAESITTMKDFEEVTDPDFHPLREPA